MGLSLAPLCLCPTIESCGRWSLVPISTLFWVWPWLERSNYSCLVGAARCCGIVTFTVVQGKFSFIIFSFTFVYSALVLFSPLILYLLWGMWVKISAELQPKSLAQASPFLLSCMLVCLYQFCAVASIFVLIKQIKFFMHEWLSLKFLKLVVFWSRVPWHSTTFVVGEE